MHHHAASRTTTSTALCQPRFLAVPEYKRLMETVRFQVRDAALIEILLQTGVHLPEQEDLRGVRA